MSEFSHNPANVEREAGRVASDATRMQDATGEGWVVIHGGESIGETNEDNSRTLDKLPVANVRTIIRPISTGRPIIIPKLPNLGGGLVV